MTNILLLRVGIDTNNAGCHSPVFYDGSFEYIPIPETEHSIENRTYNDIEARNKGKLSNYLPNKLSSSIPHYDPEFNTYTYGDPGKLKRTQLKNLEEEDLLIFYSGFEAINANRFEPRLFVIGYFIVKETFDLEIEQERNKALKLTENAHIKRIHAEKSESSGLYPVIVKGKPNKSRLFETTRILSTPYRAMVPTLAKTINYSDKKDLTYAGTARRMALNDIKKIKIKEWLDYGLSSILDNRIYCINKSKLTVDIKDGYLIVTCLLPELSIQKGDWVIGVSDSEKNNVEFILLVDYDKAIMDKYDKIGLDIELKEDSFVGSVFWFFQGKTLDISDELSMDRNFLKNNKAVSNKDKISQFISYIEHNFRLGIH